MNFVSLEQSTRGNDRARKWRTGLLAASISSFVLPLMPASAPAQTTVRYAIPAGPLDAALSRVGAASGVQLLYNSSVTRGLRTSGLFIASLFLIGHTGR